MYGHEILDLFDFFHLLSREGVPDAAQKMAAGALYP
jgi:hypothetical protein